MNGIQINEMKPIVLKTPLGFEYFDYEEIIVIEAYGNCAHIHAVNREEYVRVIHNLAFIERKYCEGSLFRCHKSYIINTIHIEKLVLKAHEIHLKNHLIVPLSRTCLNYLRQQSKKQL